MSWFVASDQFRQLSLLWRRYKVKSGLHCTDEAQKRPKHVYAITQRHVKTPLFMTQLAAGLAAKGLLNLMTSSPVATGLAH